jgi:adenosylmethionine-8-amino-7-oxononanoate aminotransferase
MVGIELEPKQGRYLGVEVCDRVRHHGVILRPLGDVVVWMPPLTLSSEELAALERATTAAIGDVVGST